MARLIMRWLLALLFLLAGTLHLIDPGLFLPIVPPQIPFPWACVIISGVAELAGGLGLILPLKKLQRAAGWGLMALLLAVFPANIYMAVANVKIHGFPAHDWEAWVRLPLQAVLLALVAWASGAWSGICAKGAEMKQLPPSE